MKKVLKNRIFIVIITMILCISGTLYGVTKYYASDVLYNEITVEEALNELYEEKTNSTSTAILLYSNDTGRTISKITKTYNVKTLLEEKGINIATEKLTEDNFIISITNYTIIEYTSSSKIKGNGGSIIKSYDTATSDLTLTFPNMSSAYTSNSKYFVAPMDITFDVYLIVNYQKVTE